MITYEVKLKKIGEMTTLPDSQRLFGFLMNFSKKYCTEDEISSFVKGVREQKQKCMISNIVPSGYYPTPKEYIMQKLQKRLEKNQEEIQRLEKEQINSKKESEKIIQELIEKKNQENEDKTNKKKGKKLNKTDEKEKLEKEKNEFNKIAISIDDLSAKHIHETLKSMDFVAQNQFKELLDIGKKKEIIKVKELKEFKYIKKTKTFIQKFRLESQMKELPGMPNVAYSLPILSFKNKSEEIQKEFSFFVRVEKESCISKALKELQRSFDGHEIPCFLGGKASAGYNEYRIYDIEELEESKNEKQEVVNVSYLNLGVLLPNFDNIQVEDSVLEIHTSDRKPFEIENEVSKVISFITAGSIITVKNDTVDPYQIGKSIDNSKYNPLYNKNTIIFGNSYLVKLEAHNET